MSLVCFHCHSKRGLLNLVSANRICNHIPRIMPNLCICQGFDMLAQSDDYHALFAHLAVGKINNEIQHQFRQQALRAGSKPRRGFGHCQRLHLTAFSNTRKSFLGVSSCCCFVLFCFLFCLRVKTCWAPHLNMSPKHFTVATITLFSASKQIHCTLVVHIYIDI